MKKLLFFIITYLCSFLLQAQMLDPITWRASIEQNEPQKATVLLKASIEDGWHIYGLQLPAGGPVATSFTFDLPSGVSLDGEIEASVSPISQFDPVFKLQLSWWESGDVTFRQKLDIAPGAVISNPMNASVRFQGCDDRTCIAPQKLSFELKLQSVPSESNETIKKVQQEGDKTDIVTQPLSIGYPTGNIQQSNESWWEPVKFENEKSASISETPWWHIFIWGFGGGLLALLTPCVWPLIPMTVSFFLKKSSSKRKAIGDALTYGLSIIILYLGLGLAITLIFGASKLNDLATNAVFNLLFFFLLIIFAISFFGAFNISLPSRWSNKVDSKAEKTTGLISIFFMAFTLALVSFSCTGPIIGTLLVEAASMGDIAGPAIGMGAFSLALAIPFTLFAIFPSWLKEMPRSGGWLNTVKVVLGFLELALSLKFLSVADLAYGWEILDREVFLALWIVIFTLLGFYLLGKLRFAHDEEKSHVSIVSFFFALLSFSLSVYLVPGLWGAPLKGVSAFVPPLYTQDFNLYVGGRFEEFDDYDAGMAYAAESHRPVIIDFSGYGCVNCRKMEGAVFDTPEVERIIKEDFVLIKLMVDDKKDLPEPIKIVENDKTITLETVGDKWSYLQRMKFGANSQPYYVMLDNAGRPLESPAYYDENVSRFVEWLGRGIENYSKNN